MKKIFLLACLLIAGHFVQGQILKKVSDRVKGKAENNANNKVDSTADKAAADILNPKSKNQVAADTTKKDEVKTDVKNETAPVSFKAYSKYDFVPGEKVIGFEDFSTGSIGDFPAGWNTNGAGEIVTIEGKQGRWLWLTNQAYLSQNSLINIRKISLLNSICYMAHLSAAAHSTLQLPRCKTWSTCRHGILLLIHLKLDSILQARDKKRDSFLMRSGRVLRLYQPTRSTRS
jgi:hypothetical protein